MAPTATHHDERIDLRLPSEAKRLISRAAAYEGTTLSAFLVSAAKERARELVAEHEVVTLTSADWEALIAAIDNTEKPRPRLAAAAKKYRKQKADSK